MFRAQIIEHQEYYKFRRRQLFYLLLPTILMGILVNFYKFPLWISLVLLGGYVGVFFLMLKNKKALDAFAGDSWLEIDTAKFAIKTKAGKVKETIKLEDVRQIILQEEYAVPEESLRAIKEEMLGDQAPHEIVLDLEKGRKNFRFEIDTHYNTAQLQELITFWKAEGLVNTSEVAVAEPR